MDNLAFIYKRHSVRQFKNQDVPHEDILEILKAATYAPSGKNTQNWHFVVLKNKKKIQELAKIIEDKTHEIANYTEDDKLKKGVLKFLHYHTFFKDAPVLILVFAGPYSIGSYDLLKQVGKIEEAKEILKSAPGIQNIGAAMENLLLAAAAKGYGTCWMTGPNYAAREIETALGFEKEGYYLAAMTPLGLPEKEELNSPPRKDLQEVITIIE
ncbi:nitroreductase family protein [Clostridium formicaceticum]|nr:nitroreductase family protein [Clostridium formicaceticum]AOY78378.1 nitroreductase [Clostridium formicaceticum]